MSTNKELVVTDQNRTRQWEEFWKLVGVTRLTAYEAGARLRKLRDAWDGPEELRPTQFSCWAEELRHEAEAHKFNSAYLKRWMQLQEFADQYRLNVEPAPRGAGLSPAPLPIDLIAERTLRPLMKKESAGTNASGHNIYEYAEPPEVREAVATLARERAARVAAGEMDLKQAVITRKDINRAYVDVGYDDPAEEVKRKAEARKLEIAREVIQSGYNPEDFIIAGDDLLLSRIFNGVIRNFRAVVSRMKPSAIDTSSDMSTEEGIEFLLGVIRNTHITTEPCVTESRSDDGRSITVKCVEHAYGRILQGVTVKGDPIPFTVTITATVGNIDEQAV